MKDFIKQGLLPCMAMIIMALGIVIGIELNDKQIEASIFASSVQTEETQDEEIEEIGSLLSDLETGEAETGDVSYSYFSDILGFSGYCIDTVEFDEFYVRDYFSGKCGDKNSIRLGYSSSYQVDNYMIDIDDNGVNELLCNCMTHADGHRELYVYRWNGKYVEVGYVNWLKYGLENLNYWGCNAVNTKFDDESGKIEITYYSTDNEDVTLLVDLDWLDFSCWDAEGNLPGIDIERAFEVYGDNLIKSL